MARQLGLGLEVDLNTVEIEQVLEHETEPGLAADLSGDP